MDDTEVVFLGGLYPKELNKEIHSKSLNGMQNAANTLQWNIIEGLDKNLNRPVNILNTMFVGSYPRNYKDIFIKGFRFSHVKGNNDLNLGYLNLTGIKQFVLHSVVKRNLIKWAASKKKKNKILIIYSAQLYFINAIKYIKEIDENIQVCLIVPDIPLYTELNRQNNILRRYYKKFQVKKINNEIKQIDKFVFLTKQMNEYFDVNKPFIVVEGMISNDFFGKIIKPQKQKESHIKSILYTGTLTKKYGILDLIESFRYIEEENYRLIICGDGEAKNEVIESSKLDNRIIYKGLLPQKDIFKLQREATILINPRKNNDEYTKYSFPSKMMEYLASGTPVLGYKLSGIPDEYDDYFIYFKDNSIITMASTIKNVCEKSDLELSAIGERNKKFVLAEKNNVYQTHKIIKLLRDIN